MKKVIIIGATSGIGRELAMLFAENDYMVGITGRREDKLMELRNSKLDSYFVRSFNINDRIASVKSLDELAIDLKGLDLLVFCSGIGDLNEGLDFEIEDKTNQTNVMGFTHVVNWAYTYFEKQKSGHLVAISSIGGLRGSRIAPAYNASKAFQINYLEGLRQKASKSKEPIFITDIRPGLVDTDMAKGEGLFWVMPVKKASQQIFDAILSRKKVVYITKRWRLIAWVLKCIPKWMYQRM
ncbi:MAG: SDR family NAD(P)-dependent oxidoreductase [Leadbetterella sp.]